MNSTPIFAQSIEDFNLKARKIKGNEMSAKWKKSDAYRAYRLQLKPANSNTWEDKILTIGDSYTIVNLVENMKYELRVAAYKNTNEGVATYSETVRFETDNINSEKVESKMTDESVTVNANLLALNAQVIEIAILDNNKYGFYRIMLSEGETNNYKETVKTSTKTLMLSQLKANQNYKIKIAFSAYENAPIAAYSKVVKIKTGLFVQKPSEGGRNKKTKF
jgi:hypothetical protein